MLLEYSKKGQIEGIEQELERISHLDTKYRGFVEHLYPLVNCFNINIKNIREFLQVTIQ